MNKSIVLFIMLLCTSSTIIGQSTALQYLNSADELLSKAKIREAASNYKKADSLFTLSEDWINKYKAVYGSMYCKLKLGEGEAMSNGLDAAIEEVKEKLGNNHITLADLHYLQIIHSDRFQGAKSNLIHIKKVDDILDKNEGVDDEFMAKFYNIKGITWYKLQDYQKALDYYNQSLVIKQKLYGLDSPKIGTTYNNIGVCYFVQNDLEKAAFYYEKALQNKLKVLGPDHPRVADSQFNIGMIYGEMKQYDKAEQKVREALRIANLNEEEQAFKVAHRMSELSLIYRRTNREKESLTVGEESIEYYKKANQSPIYSATGYQVQGLNFAHFGQFKKALLNFQLGFKELTGYADLDDYGYNPPLDAYSASGRMYQLLQYKSESLYQWYLRDNEIDRLKECFETCEHITACAKIIRSDIQEEMSLYSFISDSRRNFEFALEVANLLFDKTQDQSIIDRALAIYEESRAALLQRNLAVNIAKKHADLDPNLVENKNRINQEINRLILKINGDNDSSEIASHKRQILDLKEEYESIVLEIKSYLPSTEVTSGEHAGQYLNRLINDDQSQIVAWFYGEDALYRFTNLEDEITFEKLVKQDSLDLWIRDLSDLIGDSDLAASKFGSKDLLADFVDLSSSIYEDVIPDDLVTDKEIAFITDGLLSTIPLEILINNNSSTEEHASYANLNYLINKAPIRYVAAPSMLKRAVNPSGGNKILAFAPSYDDDNIPIFAMRSGFSKLNFAEKEVKNIASNFPTNLLVGSKATKQNLLNNIENNAILHFAMHAFTNEEQPAYSALVFDSNASDQDTSSVLYAYEIADLQLQAELAVLSACNTGSGKLIDGEGPISLARSFQAAGCPNTIMSFWQVDDESTAAIMQAFYHNLNEGMGKSKALQQAKLSFLQTNRKNLPFYWSAFILNGDNLPIRLSLSRWPFVIGGMLLLAGLFFVVRKVRKR